MRRALSISVQLAALTVLAAFPAGADWLVMADGTRVETDGAWSERGKLVVFTDTSGNFVSLRTAEVDLEASREATREAEEARSRASAPMVPPAAPRRPSTMRLTDDDVAHVDDYGQEAAAAEGEGAEGESGAAEEPTSRPQSLVQVVAWERETTPAGDGVLVRATLENPSGDAAVGITVNVTLYDDEGEVLATAPGRLAASGLMPGQRTEMVATFPGLFDFAAVDFDIDHRALATRPAQAMPSVEGDRAEGDNEVDENVGAEEEVEPGADTEEFDGSG